MWHPAYPADTDEPLDDDLDQDYAGDADGDGDEDVDAVYDDEPEPAAGPFTAARLTLAAKRAALRAPFYALTASAAAGYGSDRLVQVLADHGAHGAAGMVALGACVAAPAAVGVVRIRHREQLGRRCAPACKHLDRLGRWCPRCTRRLFWKSGGFYVAWTGAMALGAPDWTLFGEPIGHDGMGVLLLTGTAWLFRKWFTRHEIELPTDTPTPVLTAVEPAPEIEAPAPPPPPPRFPTPPPPDEGDLIKREWDIQVAGNKRNDEGNLEENLIAPGATLGADREDLTYGYQWFVQLPRSGSITARQLRQRAEDIAFKLGRSTNDVLLELLQGGDHREDRLRLTVITKDVLADKVPYPGPRYLPDGRIPIGLYADGGDLAYWRCKDEKGPLGGLVVGASGSGKSDLLTRIGAAMRYGQELIVVVGDGDEQGRSAPALKSLAYDFAAGAEQVMQQLEALEAWFHTRGKTMGRYYEGPGGLPVPITDPERQQSAGKLLPCRRMPGWIWIIDEFYLLTKALGREFVQRVSDLRRAMRKRGGNIIVGTQSPGLGDFAGDDVLQSQLKGDNVALLRTLNDTDQYAVGDIGCDPTVLPPDGGHGFTNDPKGRKVRFRGEYAEPEEMARWVRSLPEYQPDLPSARVYAYRCPPSVLDPTADYHQAVADEEEILRRIDAGEPLPWEEQPEPEQPPAWAVGGDGVAAPGNAGQVDDWSLPAVPAADPTPSSTVDDATEPTWRRPLNTSEVTVLRRLVASSGPIRNQQVIVDTRLSDSVVAKALRELVERGCAIKHAQGLHEITVAGRAAAVQLAPVAMVGPEGAGEGHAP